MDHMDVLIAKIFMRVIREDMPVNIISSVLWV